MKTYVLTIPKWHAAIPGNWSLQIKENGVFIPAAGREIVIFEGTQLRGGPEELISSMLQHGFIREVESEVVPQEATNE